MWIWRDRDHYQTHQAGECLLSSPLCTYKNNRQTQERMRNNGNWVWILRIYGHKPHLGRSLRRKSLLEKHPLEAILHANTRWNSRNLRLPKKSRLHRKPLKHSRTVTLLNRDRYQNVSLMIGATDSIVVVAPKDSPTIRTQTLITSLRRAPKSSNKEGKVERHLTIRGKDVEKSIANWPWWHTMLESLINNANRRLYTN